MEIIILGNGRTTKLMALGFISLSMVENMREVGGEIRGMEKESKVGLMELAFKDLMSTMRNLEMANFFGRMEINT